jgi:GT2 family glycosyltransferase
MTSSPLVYVIIINYNGMNYLKTCLSSLEQQTYPNYRIMIFDNASTDNSVEFTRKNFPQITVIQAQKNYGFAKGNNLAMKSAFDQKADYVFLINNDTELEKDLIKKLVSVAESEESIGIVGPAVFDIRNKYSVQEMGMAVDRFGYPLAIKSLSQKGACIFFVSGCAILIKSKLANKIGLFDEKYFMFAEDLDFCWRGRLSGYKIVVAENARIYHASGGSISGGIIKASRYETDVKRIFLREKNTIRTLIKNYDTSNMFRVIPFYVALLLLEAIFWSSLLEINISKNVLRAVSWNIRYLPDTLRQRVLVQSMRKISDKEIVAIMLSGYCKLSIFQSIGIPSLVDSQK